MAQVYLRTTLLERRHWTNGDERKVVVHHPTKPNPGPRLSSQEPQRVLEQELEKLKKKPNAIYLDCKEDTQGS